MIVQSIKDSLEMEYFMLNWNWVIATVCTLILAVTVKYFLRATLDLRGRTCLITGASSGIGEALAHELTKCGCRLILVARSYDKLQLLKQQLVDLYKAPTSSIKVMYLNVEDYDSITKALAPIMQEWTIDIVINNAGIKSCDRVEDQDLKMYKRIMDVNSFGAVAVTKAVLPSMIERKCGSIVMISSIGGLIASPLFSTYCSSKHAMQAFSDSLRFENIDNNIHVLVVAPSYVKTNIDISTLRGNGDCPKERRSTTQNGMSAQYCAQRIIRSLENYDDEILIAPFYHKILVYLRTWCFPFHKILIRLMKPTEVNKKTK